MERLGKALRFMYGLCWHPSILGDSDSLGPHGVSAATAVGVSALAQDLLNFEITFKVPEGLSNHVVSSKKAQARWYKKLLVAWKESNPPPKTPEEESRLVLQTLKKNQKADVEGLLTFYGLPLAYTVETTAEVPAALPEGVVYEFHTLPVDVRAVPDGDGITVYVSTSDPRELRLVPLEVRIAALERSEARARRDYTRADSLHESVIKAGYRVINYQNEEVLARKCRIRLRGIDAPEVEMPYGKEAKDELRKIVGGKCLRVLVYGEDQYGRTVGDIYCNGNFVQELMLKKGMAWHYTAYDRRAELAKWEKNARAKRVGLWASPNSEEPWEWRKKNKQGGRRLHENLILPFVILGIEVGLVLMYVVYKLLIAFLFCGRYLLIAFRVIWRSICFIIRCMYGK